MLPRLSVSSRSKKWYSCRRWIVRLLLPLCTAFLCTLVLPVFAKSPALNSANPSLPSSPAQYESLVQQGKTLYNQGQFSEAVKVLQQAVQIYQDQGDGPRQAITLSNLSLAYQQLGQWPQAEQAIAESLNLLQTERNIGDSKDWLQVKAQALNTQGRLLLAMGKAEHALTTWQQATAAYTSSGDQAGIALSLINQAQALRELGLYRRALKTLTQVNQTLHKQPDSPLKVAGLRSLGNALRLAGELDQSRQVLQQSLSTAQQLKSPPEISAALLSLGNTARSQHDTLAASEFYQKAASVSTSPNTEIQAQLNQLSLLLETKAWSRAIALWPMLQSKIANLPPSHNAVYARIDLAQSLVRLRQSPSTGTPAWSEIADLLATSVQQAKSLGDKRSVAYALGALGGLYEQTQQWSNALLLTQQALLKAQTINAPDIAYRWQWQLGRLLKAQGDIKGAIAAYTESVENLQSLRNDLVTTNPDVQFSFREEVEPVYRQLVDLLLQSELGSQSSQQNLVQARAVIESLQLAELDNFFRAACLEGKPVQLDSVVDKEDPTAAVVYPIILPDRLEVILKLPQQPLRHYRTVIAQSKVEKTLTELEHRITQPYLQTLLEAHSLSKQVYDWLIQPTLADLAKSKVKTLVFVLDGSLRNIPMAALYDGKQYLIEKYAVALTPGLQLLPPKHLEREQIKALTAGLTKARQGFAALSYVALELNQIKSSVPSTTLLNQQFTTRAFEDKINSRPFSVVHLATHGQFSSRSDKTFILTWDSQININQLSNLLQTRETKDASTNSALELLVLSACETAEGDKRAALGLAGVAVRAGARSTLASLWSLDDQSSALLMGRFDHELERPQINKAEALRLAQIALLQNPRYSDPRYWSPYVLVGNWL